LPTGQPPAAPRHTPVSQRRHIQRVAPRPPDQAGQHLASDPVESLALARRQHRERAAEHAGPRAGHPPGLLCGKMISARAPGSAIRKI